MNFFVVLAAEGNAPVTLYFPSTCWLGFVVLDAKGTVVYDRQQLFGCGQAFTQFTLQPGESKIANFTWTQVSTNEDPIPSGPYVIRPVLVLVTSPPAPMRTGEASILIG